MLELPSRARKTVCLKYVNVAGEPTGSMAEWCMVEKLSLRPAQMSTPKYTGEATERWYQMPETVRNMNSLLDTPYTVSKCPCVVRLCAF